MRSSEYFKLSNNIRYCSPPLAKVLALAGVVLAIALPLKAKTLPLISAPVNDAVRTRMVHSTHPLAVPANEIGLAARGLKMQRILLVLGAGPEQESELQNLLEGQQDRTSPNYHRWLTPDEFGEKFGPSQQDLDQVEAWLKRQGLSVGEVPKGRRWLEISGTAQQIEVAFRTSMERYRVRGQVHLANSTDISIPAALSPVVRGVVSLHDFFRQPLISRSYQVRRGSTGALTPVDPSFTTNTPNGVAHYLAPGDFAKIYNVTPLQQDGFDGTGQTIAVAARANVWLSDIELFRQIFNLPPNSPNVILNGPDPLITNDSLEAALDAEWAGAVAPGATVDLVVSASTTTSDGVDLSSTYIVDHNLAGVMSVSFAGCEQNIGPAANAFYNALWQQASAQGISVMVASGDNGAAGCDNPNDPSDVPAQGGLGVNGLGSTPFNTAVGGTEFDENDNDATFWTAANDQSLGSVAGYIPERVWNESCDPTKNLQCPSGNYKLFAGSGGVSQLYSKPTWQTGNNVPNDGKRDIPDVALTAASGHDGYLVCSIGSCQTSGTNLTGATVVGGTSVSAPAFAAIVAIVDQMIGERQGLANPVLYQLAASQTNDACDSNSFTDPTHPTSCLFYDTVAGDNSVPGLTGFTAGAGYDLATGLGSVNALNLANAWRALAPRNSTAQITATNTTTTHGQPVPVTVSVTPASGAGTATGSFSLMSDKYGAVGDGVLTGGSFSGPFTSLPGGQYNLFAHYPGDGNLAASDSNSVPISITAEGSSISLNAYTYTAAGPMPIASVPYGNFIYIHATVNSNSRSGVPTGTVTISDGPDVLGTITLSGKGEAELVSGGFVALAAVTCLPVGTHSLSASYSGDNSFNASSTSAPLVLTVTKASTTGWILLTANPQNPLTVPQQVMLGAFVVNAGPILPTGTLQFLDGNTPLASPVQLSPRTAGSRPWGALQVSLAAGTHFISAAYSGDDVYDSSQSTPTEVDVSTSALPTQTTLTTNTTATAGDEVNFNVNVTRSPSSQAPLTGQVRMFDDFQGFLTDPPTPLQNGTASIHYQWTFAGPHMVVAQYLGDASNGASGSVPLLINVAKATPSITVTANAVNPAVGKQISLTASVTTTIRPHNGGIVLPDGPVQFFDSLNGGPPQPIAPPRFLGIGNNNFVMLYTLPVILQTGNHSIVAQYLGDSVWNAVTSAPISINVGNGFQVSSSKSVLPITAGSSGSVVLTATPDPGLSGSATLSCGTGLPAAATCTFSPPSLTFTGTPVTTILTVATVGPSPMVVQAARVEHSGTASLGLIAGVGLLCISLRRNPRKLAQPKYVATALLLILFACFPGCGGGTSSSQPPPPPQQNSTTTALTSSGTKAASGAVVVLTAKINSANQTATGTVVFLEGNVALGQLVTVANNQATLPIGSLSVGTHAITARYSGDAQNLGSTSGALQQAVTGSTDLQVMVSSGGQTRFLDLTVTLQ